jgi:hypothetical protein
MVMAEPHQVLVDATGREREQPVRRQLVQLRLQIAALPPSPARDGTGGLR